MHWTSADELARRVVPLARRGTLGLLFDYDGTLTEIVPRPEGARLAPDVRARLLALATLPGVRIGVITGRSREGLASVAGDLPGIDVATNGGFRVSGPGGEWVHPEAEKLVPLLARHAAALREVEQRFPGTQLEDKTLSLSFHYRRAPEAENAVKQAVERCVETTPGLFRVLHGKAIYEILPAVAWDKGRALDVLCDRWGVSGSAVFFGDDVIDEPAFQAVRRRGGLGVRVGAEGGDAELAMADVAEVHRFLDVLANALS